MTQSLIEDPIEQEKNLQEVYDVLVIGAGQSYYFHLIQNRHLRAETGLYGIQAARYYLDIHPEARLCILESDNVIGGTWSSSKLSVFSCLCAVDWILGVCFVAL
jgi:hypothetical protein